jgi:hypothetical protein
MTCIKAASVRKGKRIRKMPPGALDGCRDPQGGKR